MGAPGYQSYAWTTQDWRTVKIVNGGKDVDYSCKCGTDSTLPSGRKRLCLPASIIRSMLRSRKLKRELINHARRKERSEPGERVRYPEAIRERLRRLDARTPRDRKRNPREREREWLRLSVVQAAARAAAARGVSERARGGGGFFPAYERAKGRRGKLTEHMRSKRNGFVARHMAQVEANDEVLWESDPGSRRKAPTDRHLALAVWAYSPEPKRLERWLRSGGWMRRSNPGTADHPLGLLAIDPGPNGAAFAFDGRGRPAGAWAWSWEETTRNGRQITGSGARALARGGTMSDLGTSLGWRVAERVGPFRIVCERVWGGGLDKGTGNLVHQLRKHKASRGYREIDPDVWKRRLFADVDEATPADFHRALEIVFNEEGGRKATPSGLRDNRHVWDAFGLGLAYTKRV